MLPPQMEHIILTYKDFQQSPRAIKKVFGEVVICECACGPLLAGQQCVAVGVNFRKVRVRVLFCVPRHRLGLQLSHDLHGRRGPEPRGLPTDRIARRERVPDG